MNTPKIFSQITKIMSELGSINKDRKNQTQGYQFRGIEDMYNQIHPLLVKNSVFCVPQVTERISERYDSTNKNGELKINFRVLLTVNHKFYAEDGSFVEVITSGEGIDTSDKASNKAMSSAMKYAFIELFSIPTEDIEDSDRTTPTIERNIAPAPAQRPTPQKAMMQPAPKPMGATTPSGVPIRTQQARPTQNMTAQYMANNPPPSPQQPFTAPDGTTWEDFKGK